MHTLVVTMQGGKVQLPTRFRFYLLVDKTIPFQRHLTYCLPSHEFLSYCYSLNHYSKDALIYGEFLLFPMQEKCSDFFCAS